MLKFSHSQALRDSKHSPTTRQIDMTETPTLATPPAAPRHPGRRDQILNAAMKLFTEKGFHASSMAELAKEARMSVGHIYHYFENKDAIIEAIVDRDMAEVMVFMDEFAQADDPVAALIDRLDEGINRHLDRQRAAMRLEVLAEAARNPRVAAKLHAVDRACCGRLVEVLSRPLGHLGEAEIAARVDAITATFQGLTIRAVQHPALDRDAVLRTTRLVIRALLTDPCGLHSKRT
jgi:TetR/AcrR family transcriptional regulator, repressor for uid operon